METEDTKADKEKKENADVTTSDVAPVAEEDQKSQNNVGQKTKTITVDLPVEEHVPYITANELQLIQFEVSFTGVQDEIFIPKYET